MLERFSGEECRPGNNPVQKGESNHTEQETSQRERVSSRVRGQLVTDPGKPLGREGQGGWVSRSQDGQSHFELQRIKDTRSQDLMRPRPWAVSKFSFSRKFVILKNKLKMD